MQVKHKIKQQHMELTFANEAKASELHAIILELCHNEISKVLTQSMDEFSPVEGNTIYIKQLELDLGTIDISDLSRELPEKVATEIHKKLAELFLNIQKEGIETKSSISTGIASLDHYLQHGFLPWNASVNDVSLLMRNCVRHDDGQLASLIRKRGQSEIIRIRLTERFSPILIKQIVKALEPQYGQFIINYHGHLMLINVKEAIVKIPSSQIEKMLWRFVFNHLLIEQGSFFNAKSFIKSMLLQFACHYNIGFNDLLNLITQGAKKWAGVSAAPLLALVNEVIKELEIPTKVSDTKEEILVNATIPTDLAVLLQQLDNIDINTLSGPILNEAAAYAHVNSELLPGKLVLALSRLHSKEQAVRAILQNGSKLMAIKMVKAIEPGNSQTIIDYHKHVITLHTVAPAVRTSRQDLENNLWIFIIINLIDNHGSYFNQKSFLHSLIAATARYYGIKMEVLTYKLFRATTMLPTKITRINSFFKLVSELYNEVCIRSIQKKASGRTEKKGSHSKLSVLEKIMLHWVYRIKDPVPSAGKAVLLAMKSIPVRSNSLLRQYLHHQQVRVHLAKFNDNEFSELINRLYAPSLSHLMMQVILLTKNLIPHMSAQYGSGKNFKDAVNLTILEVLTLISSSGNKMNDQELLKCTLARLAAKAKSLSANQLLESVNHYGNTSLTRKLHWEINRKTSTRHSNTNVQAMTDWLLSVDYDSPDPIPEGYESQQKVIDFLCAYYPPTLMESLAALSDKKRRNFLKNLNHAALEKILRANRKSNQTEWGVILYQELTHRLSGYNQQKVFSTDLIRTILEGVVKKELPDATTFINQLVRLLDSYKIPFSFFEKHGQWTLPVVGDVAEAIKEIEKRVSDHKLLAKTTRGVKVQTVKDIVANIKKNAAADIKKVEKADHSNAETIYIPNAGLVLLYPYLPYLFEQCGLATNGKFNNAEAALRGVAILHYATTGTEEHKEEDCILNKILCGLNLEIVSEKVKLTKHEKETVSSMLLVFAGHWEVIKNSNEDDVRGNWVIREGKLTDTGQYWELTVKRKAYDILLNSLPFTLSPVSNAWMKKMIIIHWL